MNLELAQKIDVQLEKIQKNATGMWRRSAITQNQLKSNISRPQQGTFKRLELAQKMNVQLEKIQRHVIGMKKRTVITQSQGEIKMLKSVKNFAKY